MPSRPTYPWTIASSLAVVLGLATQLIVLAVITFCDAIVNKADAILAALNFMGLLGLVLVRFATITHAASHKRKTWSRFDGVGKVTGTFGWTIGLYAALAFTFVNFGKENYRIFFGIPLILLLVAGALTLWPTRYDVGIAAKWDRRAAWKQQRAEENHDELVKAFLRSERSNPEGYEKWRQPDEKEDAPQINDQFACGCIAIKGSDEKPSAN